MSKSHNHDSFGNLAAIPSGLATLVGGIYGIGLTILGQTRVDNLFRVAQTVGERYNELAPIATQIGHTILTNMPK